MTIRFMIRGSSAVESLQCRNDYTTHIHCSWAEASQTPRHLLHEAVFRNRSTESPCVPIPPPSQDALGHLRVHCRYNTSMFVIHARDFFFFKVPHVKLLSKTIDLHNQVRVGPPHNLSVKVTEEGDWVLTWQSPLTFEPSSLTYQVHYRQANQRWTELEVQGKELRLEASTLVPDSEYEARVRATGERGAWTEWSPLVHWRPSEAPLPGPSNLDCVFDGEKEVLCSWELHTDLAQYVTYNLSYRINPTAQPRQCCPQPPRLLNQTDPVLRFSCSFSVAASSTPQVQLQLQLHAAPIRREFKSHKHIQPPRPTGVQVEERGSDWRLSWTLPHLGTVPIATEIFFWNADVPESNKSFSLEAATASHSIPTGSLQPSTRYSARVRALVDASRSSHYRGYSSQWSEPVHWTTRSVLWSAFMISYVTMAACVFVTVFLLYICQRRFRQWEVSIPTPVNSKVLEDISKGNQRFQVKGEMTQTESDDPHLDQAHILEPTQTSDLLPEDLNVFTSSFPSSLSAEVQTGCVLAVEDDDWYQQVPCHGLRVLPRASSASEMSEVSFNDLYMTCPRSRSSTGGIMGDEVLSPSPSSSPDDSVHDCMPDSETSVTLPEVSAKSHSPSSAAGQRPETAETLHHSIAAV
ncbi:cytokine receptor common subunit beta-like [Clupea harengus]|uniref:Cytokine receptor common subunit beta-like n=1 Tax=Clupea harengus TaxID=7950 RepID=A0A6P8F472_CLUHA|nr:cytokine receptor common subunit beta-like [Clupea harengus]